MISTYNEKRELRASSIRKNIVSVLEDHGHLTIPQIAQKINKTEANVYSAMKRLRLDGMARCSGETRGSGNRKIRLFAVTSDIPNQPMMEIIIKKARKLPQPFASMVAQMQVSQQRGIP